MCRPPYASVIAQVRQWMLLGGGGLGAASVYVEVFAPFELRLPFGCLKVVQGCKVVGRLSPLGSTGTAAATLL